MDDNKHNDKTIFNIPKPSATSTVDRNRKKNREQANSDDSLGILSLNSVNLSDISIGRPKPQDATNSFEIVNRVNELPSKYFKQVLATPDSCHYPLPNESTVSENDLLSIRTNSVAPHKSLDRNKLRESMALLSSQIGKGHVSLDAFSREFDRARAESIATVPRHKDNLSNESTISEEDLLSNPTNTSTPRSSIDVNLRESMAFLSSQICKGNINLDTFCREFDKARSKSQAKLEKPECSNFMPGENAESLLMADEMLWRNRNEMPIQNESMSIRNVTGNVSLGEFFLKKSDPITDLECTSPEKHDPPVPLISFTESVSNSKPQDNILSVTAIQRLIAEENSTSRIINYLTNNAIATATPHDNDTAPMSVSSSKSSSTVNPSNYETTHSINANEDIPKTSEVRAASPISRCSSRASSSLTDLPSGKLPIETSEVELIWGCVKVDKCVTRDFLIRNTSSKRLHMQLLVSGRQFKIRSDNRSDSESYTSIKIIMHARETKNIRVSFMPTVIGAAVELLNFQTLDPNHEQTVKQSIRLYGYGGVEKIEFENIIRDSNHKFWLTLGKLNNDNEISKSFRVKNTGQLSSFVYIAFKSKEYFKVDIQPKFFSLSPEESKAVTVSYRPSLQDLRSFQDSNIVTEMGTMMITSGAEATRGRLRRLCRKTEEIGGNIDSLAAILKETIEDEKMPPDLLKFREQAHSLTELMKLLNNYEIVVTLERDLDQTVIAQYMEETGMFQSFLQETVIDKTVIESKLTMEPSTIFLHPPFKTNDIVFLISNLNRRTSFSIYSDPAGLDVIPREGTLEPAQRILLRISITMSSQKHQQFKVYACVENEVVESLVKIINMD